jgi:hypothetical protein
MSMGVTHRYTEDLILKKADEIARVKYGRPFDELPPRMEMAAWIEAEEAVYAEEDAKLAALRAEVRRNGNHFFDDLEVERRLGK